MTPPVERKMTKAQRRILLAIDGTEGGSFLQHGWREHQMRVLERRGLVEHGNYVHRIKWADDAFFTKLSRDDGRDVWRLTDAGRASLKGQ